MGDYIDRDAVFHAMKMDIRPPFAVVRDFPAADVVQVVHGRWVICSDGYYPYCSNCRQEPKGGPSKFCPNCGAKMDKEE